MKPKLNMVGVVVTNMAKSLAFYRRLGFEIPAAMDSENHVEVNLPGGLRFAWDTLAVIQSYDPAYVLHAQHAGAYLCENAAAVNATHAEIVAAGYKSHKEPWDAFWGQRYAQVLDPDGHTIDLFAPL